MSYAPSSAFRHAATYLSSASSLSKVSNTTKLELYGLFKCVTVSPIPDGSRPSIFDMTGRAKWDAWSAAGKKYGSEASDAEARYIEIARDLGWNEHAVVEARAAVPRGSDEDIWDSDSDETQGSSEGGSGGGMGNVVSTMTAFGSVDIESALSNFALSDDAEGLSSFLDEHPATNINEADENGYTPLHLACDRGNVAIVRLLLSRGADISIKDPDDFTAAELARMTENDEIITLLEAAASKQAIST